MAVLTRKLEAELALKRAMIAQLLSECEKLELDIEAARKQSGDVTTSHFFDLPREMRDQIYDLCLVKGKVFLPSRYKNPLDPRYLDYDQYDKPELQMLSVSRQFRDESAQTLLSKNQIVLAARPGQLLLPPYDWRPLHGAASPPGPIALSSLAKQYLVNISVSFEATNLFEGPGCNPVHDVILDHRAGVTAPANSRQRILKRHDDALGTGRWETLLWSTFLKSVRIIQLDLTNCYCLATCCRMVHEWTSSLGNVESPYNEREEGSVDKPLFGTKLETIEVLGTKTKHERQDIRDSLARGLASQRAKFRCSIPAITLRFKDFVAPPDARAKAYAELDLEEMQEDDVGMLVEADRCQHDVDIMYGLCGDQA